MAVYSTPLRNKLEFYECGTCVQHAARLTTDVLTTEALVGEAWSTQASFELFHQGPENQKVRVFDALLSLPYRMLYPLLNLLPRRKILKALLHPLVLVTVLGYIILFAIIIVSIFSHKGSSHQPITSLSAEHALPVEKVPSAEHARSVEYVVSVEDVLASPQSYYHTMLRVSGCFAEENVRRFSQRFFVTLTSQRFLLKPCGSKNQAQDSSIEVVNVVRFVEEMQRVGLLGQETIASVLASDEILLFNYDSGTNAREWDKLSDELTGKVYSKVVFLGQFEAIAPRVAESMGLGVGDPKANANELILTKVLSSFPRSR